MRTIRIFWDFHGPHSKPTAEHHAKHLNEYLTAENYTQYHCTLTQETDNHSICFIDISEEHLIHFRDTLRPVRAAWVE
ncbi:MAG: hypothetical protein Q4F57_01305 [Weeksellaceae bacterium]|nr:hypothetical protein [Weeksellaceae bacterium]